MFRVTRYPMISKTESGRVGYRTKYWVAGRVRVPAGHCRQDRQDRQDNSSEVFFPSTIELFPHTTQSNLLWCLCVFLDERKLSCWADVRRCEVIREAQASAVSSYLYRNSPETQTHLVFNLIDRNMTNPPKEHLRPQLVWHLVYWQVSPPGGSPLPTADSEQQCVGPSRMVVFQRQKVTLDIFVLFQQKTIDSPKLALSFSTLQVCDFQSWND